MCTLCAATQTFDPARHETIMTAWADIYEGTDAPASTTTPYSIAVGDTFFGSIGTSTDWDVIEISLEAGETYLLEMRGQDSGAGTLIDPVIGLWREGSGYLAVDDNAGTGLDARITFTASATGTYYVVADAISDTGTGSYQLSLSTTAPPPPPDSATLDDLALFLTEGYWGNREITWNTAASNEITVNLSGLTAEGQKLARWAMEAWEMVADLEFIEVASGEMITMDDESSGAWAYAPGGFDASGVELNVSKNWLSSYGTQIDDYSFQTYIHEIGHALGLGHQGSYNGSADYGEDNTFANDSWQMSVMSYFSQTENSAISASYANTITAMMADVLAIQNLYGAAGAGSATAGNTTWGQGSNLGNFLDAYFAGLVSGSFDSALYGGSSVAFTIADVGGVDVLNLAFTDADNRIDMVAESFSDVDGLIGNVGIARGTVLENLVLGAGDDTVTGNDAANRIESGAGDDSIEAGVGADRIFAGEGNDVVMAGLGVDVTFLNQGDDIYLATGNDMSADTIWGGYGDDSITADGGGDNLLGEWGRDTLVGGSGNDQLHGGDDDDSLVAGAGADTVWGGFGRDTVFLNQGNDRFNDNGQGGEAGRDTVWGGYGRDTIQGGNGDDVFYGEWGNDVIFGRKGNDSIYGGTNFDYLSGGAGDDLIYGGYGRDRVIMGLGDDRYVDTAQTSFYGDDTITGGSGADTFVFDAVMAEDVITDFELGVDVLEFSVALAAGRSTNALADLAELRAEGVLLSFGEGQSILLQGLTTSSGLADDIVIV